MKCVVQSTQAVYKKENAPPSQAEALENIIPPKHSYSQCSAKCQLLYAHPPRADFRGSISLLSVCTCFFKCITWEGCWQSPCTAIIIRTNIESKKHISSHAHTHRHQAWKSSSQLSASNDPSLAARVRSMNMSLTSCSHTAHTSASYIMYLVHSEAHSFSIPSNLLYTFHPIPCVHLLRLWMGHCCG